MKTTPEPEKKSFSNEELKKVLEEAVKKPEEAYADRG